MRTLLSAAAGLTALFGAATANAAVVSVSTDADVVQTGEAFDVSLVFEGTQDEVVAAYVVDVFFDSILSLINVSFVDPVSGVNPLDFPGADPTLSEFLFDDFGDGATLSGVSGNDAGTLAANQPNSFIFATLTFEALAAGTADIGLDIFVDFFDPDGDLLDVTFGNEFVTVEAVPLPGALVFMATGLAGFAARRRMVA